jgi:mono/diheme cytochrome c family protein
MRTKAICIAMVFVSILGMLLTSCGSKATPTTTHPPAVQATDTQFPAAQATDTRSPAVQVTDTQPPAVQATDTQPPAVQATDTQPPANTATVAPATADGAALLHDRCTVCHNLDRVTSKKNTADQWTQVVSRMVGKGAELTSEELKVLVVYLAKTYGP